MRVIGEYVAWWLVLSGIWAGLVTSPWGWETLLAAAAGAAAAALGVRSRVVFAPPATVPAFARRLVWLPLDLALDALGLLRLLITGRAFRHDCGRLDTLILPDCDEGAARAWGIIVVAASPGSLATDIEEQRGRLRLHRHRLTTTGRAARDLERA